jgi:hypothetical protein
MSPLLATRPRDAAASRLTLLFMMFAFCFIGVRS